MQRCTFQTSRSLLFTTPWQTHLSCMWAFILTVQDFIVSRVRHYILVVWGPVKVCDIAGMSLGSNTSIIRMYLKSSEWMISSLTVNTVFLVAIHWEFLKQSSITASGTKWGLWFGAGLWLGARTVGLKRTDHSGKGKHLDPGSTLLVPPLGCHHRARPALHFQGRQSQRALKQTLQPRALFQVTSGPN